MDESEREQVAELCEKWFEYGEYLTVEIDTDEMTCLVQPVRQDGIMNNITDTNKCLQALGSAWRGDWSDFDGRTLRDQLKEISQVLYGSVTYEEFCENWSIDPDKHEWTRYL